MKQISNFITWYRSKVQSSDLVINQISRDPRTVLALLFCKNRIWIQLLKLRIRTKFIYKQSLFPTLPNYFNPERPNIDLTKIKSTIKSSWASHVRRVTCLFDNSIRKFHDFKSENYKRLPIIFKIDELFLLFEKAFKSLESRQNKRTCEFRIQSVFGKLCTHGSKIHKKVNKIIYLR